MAQIDNSAGSFDRGIKKHFLKRKLIPKIDMTPMVDLGFLLITFFIFTTQQEKPRVTKLIMPADGPPTPVRTSSTLTLLIGRGEKLYYYEGPIEKLTKEYLMNSGWSEQSGIGNIIRAKQSLLDHSGVFKKDDLMVLIKPSKEAVYKNVVKALDEMLINGVTRYTILSQDLKEEKLIGEIN